MLVIALIHSLGMFCTTDRGFRVQIFSDIQNEKNFVTNSTTAIVTPISEYHAQQFYRTINEFLEFTDPGTFIEIQNDLLNTYLDHDDFEDVKHIKNLVLYTTLQSNFLSQLKTKWENFVQFNNVKIEKI